VNSSVFASQMGNEVVDRGYDIGVIWRHIKDDHIKVSLRSHKYGKVDVGKIAEKYGGGGHKSAASFVIHSEDELPWQLKT
jgi:nanoRNase/pAp phosphatase (c-di-AMP/oligoRNAs hydrolase)